MASWLMGSAMKRLLRYALLKFELLEEDDLDLDNVNLVLGRTNTLEFRDVRLKTKRLAGLLSLPSQLCFRRARVALLRVTIPIDILSGAITVEVEGVQIAVRLAQEGTGRQDSSSPGRNQTLGGEADYSLPTAQDLAKSFLAEEPLEERKDLEAALLSQSRNLQESDVFSDDGSSDGGIGTGTALGLPAFLANTLYGIMQRALVVISNVDFELESDLESNDALGICKESKASLLLHVDDLGLEDFTQSTSNTTRVTADGERAGERQVRLRNLSVRLKSDPSIFANFPRPSRAASPAEPRSPSSESGGVSAFRSQSASSPVSSHGFSRVSSLLPSEPVRAARRSLSRFDRRLHSPEPGKTRARNRSFKDREHSAGTSSRRDWPERPTQTQPLSIRSQAIDSPHLDFGATNLEFVNQLFLDYTEPEDRFTSHPGDEFSTLHQSSTGEIHRLVMSSRHGQQARFKQNQGSKSGALSTTAPDVSRTRPRGAGEQSKTNTQTSVSQSLSGHAFSSDHPEAPLARVPSSRSSGSRSSGQLPADLAESKIFSHDEAESMYMSALSDVPGINMPGGWDSSESLHRSELYAGETEVAASPRTMEFEEQKRERGPQTPRECSTRENPSTHYFPEADGPTELKVYSDKSLPASAVDEKCTPELDSASPSNMAIKDVLSIDIVSLRLPLRWGANAPAEQTEVDMGHTHSPRSMDAAQSTSRHFPGSFSQYADSTTSSRRFSAREITPVRQSFASQGFQASTTAGTRQNATPLAQLFDIVLESVNLRVDLTVILILIQILKQTAEIMKSDQEQSKKPSAVANKAKDAFPPLNITVEKLSLQFFERIQCPTPGGTVPAEPDKNRHGEVSLFKMEMKHLVVSSTIATELKVGIHRFIWNLDADTILCFDASNRSTASIKEPSDQDIAITYRTSAGKNEIDIMTLPVRMTLDVRKIDESLGYFGGLSGILELSNSVSSTNTGVLSPVRAPPRGRGVRFAGETDAPLITPLSGWKINARFGGFSFMLTGKTCGVSLETTSIKVVGRESGIGASFGQLRITGPYFDASEKVPPLSISLGDARLEFAFVPEEKDLEKLVSLITPSSDKFEDDDDILLDTLLRQRKKGSLLRVIAGNLRLNLSDPSAMSSFQYLGEELSKLASVTRYLPEDDRPGILSMLTIANVKISVESNSPLGPLRIDGRNLRVGHVGIPPLLALGVDSISVEHSHNTQLVTPVLAQEGQDLPVIMVRLIGDEMIPTIKIKLFNMCFEYHVSTILAAMGMTSGSTSEDLALSMAESVATITGRATGVNFQTQSSQSETDSPSSLQKAMHVDLVFRECAIGLNPQGSPSKILFLLSDARFLSKVPSTQSFTALLEINKAYLLIVNDVANLTRPGTPSSKTQASTLTSGTVPELCMSGYVLIGTLSKAAITFRTVEHAVAGRLTEIDVKNELFFMETCADSTQTMINVLGSLSPPKPPSTALAYRTQVVPMEDMMASFTGDAFVQHEDEDGDEEPVPFEDDPFMGLDNFGSFYEPGAEDVDEITDASRNAELSFLLRRGAMSQILDNRTMTGNTTLESLVSATDEGFLVEDDFYSIQAGRKPCARGWDSARNAYGVNSESKIALSPLKVRIRDVHFIWNLFDGYDWARTRLTIEKAVHDVEAKLEERRKGRRLSHLADQPKEEIISDFLFNSIWIEVPTNREPGDLARQINRNVDDLASETESYAATITTMSPTRSSAPKPRRKRLRLQRSKQHKISFELNGISADVNVFPPNSGETQSSVDVQIGDLDVFDRVPTSTWRKFATYMKDAGEREMGKPMIHLELLNVKPIEDLAASELVIRVTVLPLRLHVDQDALDFITRFFEFKDEETKNPAPASEQPFLQRLEVNTIVMKLDYKPKKVDYSGLRSGHTTEMMNFVILDSADIVLRHCIIYGISGFDKLHKTLNDIWMPDVKRNQLPGILAGLAPVRSLVNVGSGVRDLVYIPMREYRKDGRIVRSVQKGAVAFARTTTSELARLGAKLAIGTQNVLQGAEELLSPVAPAVATSRRHGDGDWDDASYPLDEEQIVGDDEVRAVSHYADQPIGVLAGLRDAARSLERDLLTARDAIVAIPGEIMDSESLGGAARAIARRAPTVILRPAIGASKAVGMTLLGAGNALDKESRRRIDDKYKKY